MSILGLDLGAKFGWAVLDTDGNREASGTFEVGKRKPENLLSLLEFLERVILRYGILTIAYEKVHGRHSSKNAAHAYGGYETLVWVAAAKDGITNIQQVTVQQVKKTATGDGSADKEDVEAAAWKRWDHLPEDDNESDALFCAEYVRQRTTKE